MSALAKVGPLAVNVQANTGSSYEEGVSPATKCGKPTTAIDHVVQLVGYTPHAWIVRNSWTPLWGEDGYIRLARTANPTCGMDINPLDGNGCKGGPPQVKVCGQSGVLYDGVYPTVK